MKLIAIDADGPGTVHQEAPVLSLDIAHIYRSKIVDKCAEAERHVVRLLRMAGNRLCATAPLSQKVDTLKRALAQRETSCGVARIEGLIKRLEPLSHLRTELAHSTLSLAEVEGSMVAVLRNAASQEQAEGRRTILTLQSFLNRYRELSDVANSLGQAADQVEGAGFPRSRE